MTGGPLSVLRAAALIGPVTIAVGAAWTWILPAPLRAQGRLARWATLAARALLLGIVICSFTSLLLGIAGAYTSIREAAVLGGISLLGAVVGAIKAPRQLAAHVAGCVPGAAGLLAAIAVILCLPIHSEWIVGGLDPGVYVNEGIVLAREATFNSPDDFFHDRLTTDEQTHFTRSGKGRTERFPGVAVDTDRRALDFEFFRLFPALVARLYRAGGLNAAVRVNSILGVFVCLVLGAALIGTARPLHGVVATVLLLMQPIWLYHLHVPVTEMLQLVLVCGLGLLLPWRKTNWLTLLSMCVILLAAVLTHFSFFPTGALFVCAVAWIDMERDDRGRVWIEHILMLLAIVAGGLIDSLVAPLSFAGWEEGLLPVLYAGGALAVLALAVDLVACLGRLRTVIRGWCSRIEWCFGALVAALLAGLLAWGYRCPANEDAITMRRLLHYVGVLPAVAALVGGALVFRKKEGFSRHMQGLVLFWTGLLVVLLLRINDWTIPYYPWALRRYLVCAVPLVSVCLACFLVCAWRVAGRYGIAGRIACSVAVLFAALTMAGKCRAAWSHTEYVGAHKALEQLAARIEPADVVVVDHPVWGMPLSLIFDRRVLNARHFYRRGAETMGPGLAALKRLSAEGTRVRFLTSTAGGLGVYPLDIEGAVLEWESEPVCFRTVVQHRKAHDFETRRSEKIFRLHSLEN